MGYPSEEVFEEYRSNRGGIVVPSNLSYRDEVLRTCPGFGTDTFHNKLSLSALGLSGESGEVADLIKKVLYHGTPLDKEKLIKEIGDVRWYLEYLAASLNVSMEEVESKNVQKLRTRYPEGFSHEAANKQRKE